MTRNKIEEGGGPKKKMCIYIYIYAFIFFGPPPNSIDFAKEKKRDKFGPKLSRKENPSRCLVRNALDAANGVWIGANVLA